MGSTSAGSDVPRSLALSHAVAHPARLSTPAAAASLSAARWIAASLYPRRWRDSPDMSRYSLASSLKRDR